jgi:O-antigen/teichoic acid export membrane protein
MPDLHSRAGDEPVPIALETPDAGAEGPAPGTLAVATTISRRAVSGVLWSGVSRLGQQTAQFAISVVLARLLVPEEFGLVAEALVFSSFALVILDFGFSAALIQREDLEERHLSSAFWLNLGVGAALTAALIGASPLIADFYNQPRLRGLAIGISATFLLGSLGLVQATLLERALNFRRLAAITNIATAVGGAAAITAAAAGLGAWSIVLQATVAIGARSLLLWLSSDWRPALSIDAAAVRDLWRFGANLAAFNAVNFWSRNADDLLIGRFATPSALGLYGRAYSVMLVGLNQVTSTVSVAMYPALARIQDDRDRLRLAYLRVVSVVALLAFPIAVGLFVAARPFVLTLFGERWTGAIRILQILCIPLLIQSVASTVGLIYQVSARTDWMFRWGVAASAVTVAAFAVGIHWGIVGVATSYAIVSVAMLYFNFSIPGRLVGVRPADVARVVRGPLAAAMIMGGCVWAAGYGTAKLGAPAQLVIEVGVGVTVYALIAELLPLDAFREVRKLIGRERANLANANGIAKCDEG